MTGSSLSNPLKHNIMKVTNAHTFTNEEENLIRGSILMRALNMADENGETNHLSLHDKKVFDKLMEIWNNF